MTDQPIPDARSDWEQRIYLRSTDLAHADPTSELPAPAGLRSTAAAGHVRLDWEPVPGAAGYLVERAVDGQSTIVGHGGSDVPAVPGICFADTGVRDATTYSYRVGAVLGNEYPVWHWSETVEGRTSGSAGGAVHVEVDAGAAGAALSRVWWLIGSERLTQLRFGADDFGNQIGAEFADSLRMAHEDLGVEAVRAHAILHDDNRVATRGADGSLHFDFARVDGLYDEILAIGVRPVVELGFMPAALARNPQETVFTYRGIISPPTDWTEWHDLVHALVAHLVQRYGVDEVATWGFEVWNEPNLEVFWTGSQEDYLRLYEEAARAVKAVDERLTVGGPSTAASEWVEALAAYADKQGLPLELATTHTYGNLPLDFRPVLEDHGFADAEILWTEWGVGSTHFGPIHDGVAGAPFILSGYKSVQGRMSALSYWVVSDHFEELGRPPSLFHDGFGLLTVGNLRKPRYWAVQLAAQQGDTVLPSVVSGDGAEVLVESWSTVHDDGTVDVLVWNGTRNADLMAGDPRLVRRVSVTVEGLGGGPSYTPQVARVDANHSNITAHAPADDWPTEQEWAALRAADRLETETLPAIDTASGSAAVEIDVPQPGVARIRLSPDTPVAARDEEYPA